MKTTSTFIVILASAFGSYAQTVSHTDLDLNQVRARINNNGIFFNDRMNQRAGYGVPKGDNVHAIYVMNIMAGGEDINGQLKLATTDYTNSDFFFGPITEQLSQYNTQSYIDRYSTLWTVTRAEVNAHIASWQSANYQVPQGLQSWPGNGNVQNGEPAKIAPFFDRDNDGLYEPADGDYPLIRGDKAVFCILNDSKDLHPSGSNRIGFEVHLMFYQFNIPGVIGQTTFISSTIINRGSNTLYNFHFGSMIDFNLGNYNDDYIGTDTLKNMAYVYNGSTVDNNFSGILGYGQNPPAVGVMTLNKPLNSHISPPVPSEMPSTQSHYYNLLQGKFRDGGEMNDDQGDATRYAYYGGQQGWSEMSPSGPGSASNPQGNRISFIGFPAETLRPFETYHYDYAVVYARDIQDTSLFGSVDDLLNNAVIVQDFYNRQDYGVGENEVLSLSKHALSTLTIYPNPVNDKFVIRGVESGSFKIMNLSGQLVASGEISNSAIDLSSLAPGVYTVLLYGKGETSIARLVKQ